MLSTLLKTFYAPLLAFVLLVDPVDAAPSEAEGYESAGRAAEIGFLEVDRGMTLRRMLVPNPGAENVVILLHGFPETIYAWEAVAGLLGADHEVHAFDWPGFGLSSRPDPKSFSYSPMGYAKVLRSYIRTTGIDKSKLTIYATDIGALPALLLALEEPEIAKRIIVGDFAPFDRPNHMYPQLQELKTPATADSVRILYNANRDEILGNSFTRGLPEKERYEISATFKSDLRLGWDTGAITPADAFFHYYSNFSRDQRFFESNAALLRTPVKVVWGEKDPYINKDMGVELARQVGTDLILLGGIGHYAHLQDPKRVADEIRASPGRQ